MDKLSYLLGFLSGLAFIYCLASICVSGERDKVKEVCQDLYGKSCVQKWVVSDEN